jgi:NAD(P)H dehydrogenase (quinone)
MYEDVLAGADALIFGTPTRFGMMTAELHTVLDGLCGLWSQESTIRTFHVTLLHLGMIIAGLPYSERPQMKMDEITGGSPYGASTISGDNDGRQPSENELAIARFQGRHVAQIAKKTHLQVDNSKKIGKHFPL